MNKIILVLYIVKYHKQIEVIFDNRLSFIENLSLLNELYNLENINNIYLLDSSYVFLKKEIPIKDYEFKNFDKIYIFNN